MKVGILTFSEENNYGAMLQAYALQETVAGLGHAVEIIRYPRDPELLQHYRHLYWRMRSLRRYVPLLIADFVYERFRRKYYRRSPLCRNESELRQNATRYDAIIVGSDQIWNYELLAEHALGSTYFLNFAEGLNFRRISYAASVGCPNQPTSAPADIPRWLNRFNNLSVREDFSCKVVGEWTGRTNIPVVADPTLLSSFSSFPVKVPRRLPQKFILVYPVPGYGISIGNATLSAIKRKIKLPVVAIVATAHTDFEFPGADIYVRTASPPQFIAMFSRASYVLTNSFHGTIFAIKKRIPFSTYVEADSSSAHRIYDLTTRYGLRDRVIDNAGVAENVTLTIASECFDNTHSLIAAHVANSRVFLQKALQ